MKKVPKSVWKTVLLAAAIYVGWSAVFSSDTWRYRMTVVVETPEGIKTGSAVREVTFQKKSGLLPQATSHIRVKGEAVVVNLGKFGVLFALLCGTTGEDYGSDVLLRAFNKKGDVTLRPSQIPWTGKATITPDQYPMFVRFLNLNDPRTIESVTKIEKSGPYGRRFFLREEMFGAGVKLKEITIEITPDAVTTGIVKLLPWLPNYYNKRLDGQRFGDFKTFANSLSAGEFSTEVSPYGR